MICKSYAKLNLYLEVLSKRRDGFHALKTVFERIDLSDKIILTRRPDKEIKISCDNPFVPCDKTNLGYRSAELLQKKFKISCGAKIDIAKRIPVGAGLGGGSSNAAAVLVGLNKLWRLNLSQGALAHLAAGIGSDVPFFIYNTSFALASGRGDKVEPLRVPGSTRLWHVLVVPRIRVSTPLIYKKWDEGKFSGLTKARALEVTKRQAQRPKISPLPKVNQRKII